MDCDLCKRTFGRKSDLDQHLKTCKFLPGDIEEINRLYSEGFSQTDLSRKFNVGIGLIRKNLRVATRTRSEVSKGRSHTEETKQKIRLKRFEYMSKRTGLTPWERRNKREMSSLEEWFYEDVILKESLNNKYQISYDYPYFPYFIDFVFHEQKLAVELDGPHHLREENIRHDEKKNSFLVSEGWNVYRIRFDECNDAGKKLFLEHLAEIPEKIRVSKDAATLEIDRFKLLKKKKLASSGRNDYFEALRQENFRDIHEPRIAKLRREVTNVDLTKFGWVGKVAQILGIKHQKVRSWMKKYCPDLLESSKVKRNST